MKKNLIDAYCKVIYNEYLEGYMFTKSVFESDLIDSFKSKLEFEMSTFLEDKKELEKINYIFKKYEYNLKDDLLDSDFTLLSNKILTLRLTYNGIDLDIFKFIYINNIGWFLLAINDEEIPF